MRNPMQKLLNILNDFLQKGSQSKIGSSLKCGKNEIKILQCMLENYLLGTQECSTKTIISKIFSPKGNDKLLSYLPHFQNLLALGYICDDGLLTQGSSQPPILELLHMDVTLSKNFLRLLEGKESDLENLKITPYKDQLEYLRDQFLRISLLYKLSEEKPNISNKTSQEVKKIEEKIHSRLQITPIKLPLEELMQENHLSSKEKILFLALLKEEYSSGNENLRDMNTLIELISQDEYEKMKNRALLDEHSTLLERRLLDYDEIINPFGGFSRTFYIKEEILQYIFHPKQKSHKNKILLQNLVQEQEIFELIDPKVSLDSVVLPNSTLKLFHNLLQQTTPKVAQLLKHWGIKSKKGIDARIIFYGPPGTGKTMSALALAKSLKKQVLSLDCSKILSMYVGESEKNVKKIFDQYKEITKKIKNPPILLLDEADQFLSLRVSSTNSTDKMHNQMQNIFLEQIEKFEGILIATTNLLEHIDSAFSRRFNHKIEFKRPNLEERIKLWEKNLPKNAEFRDKDKQPCDAKHISTLLAQTEFTGAQISMIVRNTAYSVAIKAQNIFTYEDFLVEIHKEKLADFQEGKLMGFKSS